MNYKYSIGYLIATYNRWRCIKEYLTKALPELNEIGDIAIYIADGSEDNKTQQIVKKYGTENVFYYHRPDLSLADRVTLLLEECDCQYVCIAGDSRKPIKESLYKIIDLCKKNYSIIQTIGQPRPYTGREHVFQIYDNIVDFYKEHAQETITISTTYFRKEDYQKKSNIYDELCKEENAFSQVAFYFHCFSGDQFSACFISIISQKDELIGKPDSVWASTEQLFKVWWYDLLNIVSSLPAEFDEVRFSICSVYSYGLNFDSADGFLSLRMRNSLDDHLVSDNYIALNLMSKLSFSDIKKIAKMSPKRAMINYYIRHPRLLPYCVFRLLPYSIQLVLRRLLNKPITIG